MGIYDDYFKNTIELEKTYGKHKTIVLMQVGDFYEVYGLKNKETNEIHGSNIMEFSKALDMQVTPKNDFHNNNIILMSGFPVDKRDHHSLRLYNAGFTIAIYDQEKDSEGNVTGRPLSEKISLGTFFYSENEKITNNCSCVWIDKTYQFKTNKHKLHVGMATIDVYTGQSFLFQYNTDYETTSSPYDELERFLISYQPNQMIFIHNLDDSEIDNIIKFLSVNTTTIHKYNTNHTADNNIRLKQIENCRKQPYQKQIISKFFQTEILDNYCRWTYATDSFCFLLEFVHEHNPSIVKKMVDPIFQNSGDRVILANHSLKQLNITSNSELVESSKTISSLSKFLNKCKTAMGKRLLHNNILNPIKNVDDLNKKYNIVKILRVRDSCDDKAAPYTIDNVRNQLPNIMDIDKLNRKIRRSRIRAWS